MHPHFRYSPSNPIVLFFFVHSSCIPLFSLILSPTFLSCFFCVALCVCVCICLSVSLSLSLFRSNFSSSFILRFRFLLCFLLFFFCQAPHPSFTWACDRVSVCHAILYFFLHEQNVILKKKRLFNVS